MSTRNKRIEIHTCKCEVCGQEMYVPRPYRKRKMKHIKDLYCFRCQQVTHFREFRDWELPTMHEAERAKT